MILRIYRRRASAGARGRILAHLRDAVYPANVRTPGLRSFQAGIRDLEDGSVELALVSTWLDFDALLSGIGPDTLRPASLAPVADVLAPMAADHYELVGEELTGVVPLAGGAVRMVSGRLASGHGEAFFEFARTAQSEQLDAGRSLSATSAEWSRQTTIVANFCLGGPDGRWLFICATDRLFRLRTLVRGGWPSRG